MHVREELCVARNLSVGRPQLVRGWVGKSGFGGVAGGGWFGAVLGAPFARGDALCLYSH